MSTARERLAARQSAVLDALLSGEVPDDFDQRTTSAAGRLLRAKRRYEAVTALPEIRALPDLVERFDEWARRGPRRACACADAREFVADLATRRRLPEPLRSRWLADQVADGRRRVALVRRNGRRVLDVGLGNTVVHLAVRAPQQRTTDLGG